MVGGTVAAYRTVSAWASRTWQECWPRFLQMGSCHVSHLIVSPLMLVARTQDKAGRCKIHSILPPASQQAGRAMTQVPIAELWARNRKQAGRNSRRIIEVAKVRRRAGATAARRATATAERCRNMTDRRSVGQSAGRGRWVEWRGPRRACGGGGKWFCRGLVKARRRGISATNGLIDGRAPVCTRAAVKSSARQIRTSCFLVGQGLGSMAVVVGSLRRRGGGPQDRGA